MTYDTIIIGAGIGGLAASLKLSSQGKSVLLLEKNASSGGYAMGFQRKGFKFESAIHCVDALGKNQELREFLEEYNLNQKLKFIDLPNFVRLIYPEDDLILAADKEKFIALLKEKFPAESKNIARLFSSIDKFYRQFDHFSESNIPLWLKLLLSPFIYSKIIQTSRFSCREFFNAYIKDERLLGLLTSIWGFFGLSPKHLSSLYFLIPYRGYHFYPTAYIEAGFSRLFQAILEKIKENGAEVKFNTLVKEIIIEKGRIKGVVTSNNEKFFAQTVIANANPLDVLGGMLSDEKLKEAYLKKLNSLEKSLSAIQVYLGLNLSTKDLGLNHYLVMIYLSYNHEENFQYILSADYEHAPLELVDHSYIDPTLAPEGKSTLTIFTLDKYQNWINLTELEYKKKKEAIAQILIQRVEKYLPGLKKHIEVVEVASPYTMYKYTFSAEGAIYGFAQTLNQSGLLRLGQETKIKGLFLAGAWTQPGAGVHACFLSGFNAADLVLDFLK